MLWAPRNLYIHLPWYIRDFIGEYWYVEMHNLDPTNLRLLIPSNTLSVLEKTLKAIIQNLF